MRVLDIQVLHYNSTAFRMKSEWLTYSTESNELLVPMEYLFKV